MRGTNCFDLKYLRLATKNNNFSSRGNLTSQKNKLTKDALQRFIKSGKIFFMNILRFCQSLFSFEILNISKKLIRKGGNSSVVIEH
jgi:hypothetical protein